jgi:hypothetical protein
MKNIEFNTERIQKLMGKVSEAAKKDPTMNEMIARMKNYVNEQMAQSRHLTDSELDVEKRKFENAFSNYNVSFEYEPFSIVYDGVFWSGVIDGQIQWVYMVTKDDSTSGVELNFAPDFNPDEGDNKKIVEIIQSYYNQFYKYWRENELELDNSNSDPMY